LIIFELKKGLVILVVALSALVPGCPRRQLLSQPPELYLHGAQMRLESGDIQGAKELYEELLSVEPVPAAWFGLSNVYAALGDTAMVVQAYFKGMALADEQQKSDPVYWMRLGRWYGRQNRHEEAIRCFARALEIDPHNAKALNNIGVIYFQEKQYEEALDAFKRSVDLDPSDPSTWHNLGLANHYLGRYEEAIACYMASLHLYEARPQVWNDLGVSYKNIGEYDKALRSYDRALELAPADSGTWKNKGLLLESMGKPEEALFCFMKWADLSPSGKAYAYAASIAMGLGKDKLAQTLLDRAFYLQPLGPWVWALRIEFAWKSGGTSAVSSEIRVVERYLGHPRIVGTRAFALRTLSGLTHRLEGLE